MESTNNEFSNNLFISKNSKSFKEELNDFYRWLEDISAEEFGRKDPIFIQSFSYSNLFEAVRKYILMQKENASRFKVFKKILLKNQEENEDYCIYILLKMMHSSTLEVLTYHEYINNEQPSADQEIKEKTRNLINKMAPVGQEQNFQNIIDSYPKTEFKIIHFILEKTLIKLTENYFRSIILWSQVGGVNKINFFEEIYNKKFTILLEQIFNSECIKSYYAYEFQYLKNKKTEYPLRKYLKEWFKSVSFVPTIKEKACFFPPVVKTFINSNPRWFEGTLTKESEFILKKAFLIQNFIHESNHVNKIIDHLNEIRDLVSSFDDLEINNLIIEKEGGERINMRLFNCKYFNGITLPQAKFILDINNYDNNFNDFHRAFDELSSYITFEPLICAYDYDIRENYSIRIGIDDECNTRLLHDPLYQKKIKEEMKNYKCDPSMDNL